MEDHQQATEVWFLRRMLKIKWTHELLRLAVIFREFITVATIQIRFVGHVLRKAKLKQPALTGKRARGRQRLAFLGWLQRSISAPRQQLEVEMGK